MRTTKKQSTRKTKTRYFVDELRDRIVVFVRGKEPGKSYFMDGDSGPAWWSLEEMGQDGGFNQEIDRESARKLLPSIP